MNKRDVDALRYLLDEEVEQDKAEIAVVRRWSADDRDLERGWKSALDQAMAARRDPLGYVDFVTRLIDHKVDELRDSAKEDSFNMSSGSFDIVPNDMAISCEIMKWHVLKNLLVNEKVEVSA